MIMVITKKVQVTIESTTSPRPAVSVKISKDGIAWLLATIEETSLGVFKIVSEEVKIRFGQSISIIIMRSSKS